LSLGKTCAVLVVLASSLIGVPQASAQHRADGVLSDWAGSGTSLAGQTRISGGELIYDDWLYDDYGADIDNGTNQPVFRGNLAPTQGDYRYPTNSTRYGYNAADLRQLRVAADASGLHLLVYLQTMKASNAVAVTVALDNPRDHSPTASWPDAVGITTPGADRFITFWGTGGWITRGGGQRQALANQAVNLSENAIEVDVPWSALGSGYREHTVRMWVVSGLADAAAGRYKSVPAGPATATTPGGGGPTGSTAAFDLGFDANEQFPRLVSHWGEDVQSQALSSGDISNLSKSVDLGELADGGSDQYAPQPGRFYNRIFRSVKNYGEGIVLKNDPSSPGGSPDPQFLSRFQPYGLYIPADYRPGTRAPLLINGHSLDVNQNEYEAVSPNFYTQIGDQRSSFVITPLARGMDTWYINAGFKDVLETWEDVKAHYSIDDNRTSIGGYSMGGYMTYRMGLLMPDRFAAAADYVGPPAYQLWQPPFPPQPTGDYTVAGQTNNIVYNGLNLPFEINDGVEDELVPVAGPVAQAQTFRDVGNPHLFYLHPTADHFALILADQWDHTKSFLDQHPQRNLSPDEVRYKRYPSMDLSQYGLRFDGAYWVDGMAVRAPSDACSAGDPACEAAFGQVEAYTLAHGRARSTTEAVNFAYPGPPLPATVQGTNRIPGAPIASRNAFGASFANLSAIAFDVTRMGIAPSRQIRADLSVDAAGPVTITLRGSFPSVIARLDGNAVPVARTADGIKVTVNLTGQNRLIVTPQ
jgi:dienelactone hydrolase